MITKDPVKAAKGCDVVLLAVPAFAHQQYLEELAPHLEPGTIIVGIPGQPGFDFAVRSALGLRSPDFTIMVGLRHISGWKIISEITTYQ